MVSVVVQISDPHIGGPKVGSEERFSEAVGAVNAMSRQPDLVVITGDLTQSGTSLEWAEFRQRIQPLRARWEAIRGNHDRGIDELAGHRTVEVDDMRVVLLDTSDDQFDDDDASWLDAELSAHAHVATVVAIHHPPFDTGIWWMDCVGLRGSDGFRAVVRRHPQVRHVMSGHVHRPITTTWGACLLTACPSTAVAVAADLDPAHEPAETDEAPMIAIHAYLGDSVVSHVAAVGPAAARSPIAATAPEFVVWARDQQATRTTAFNSEIR